MHECPFCGQMCDCDGDDLFHSIPPDDCTCDCEEFYDEDECTGFEELEEFGCVLPGKCMMSGLHLPSECHTAEMLEEAYREGV